MTRSINSRSFSAHSVARILFIAMIALTVFAATAHAQRRGTSSSYTPTSQHVTFGGELALPYMISTFSTASLSGIGLHIGAVADIPVAPKTGILAKVGYESKHASGSVRQEGATVDMAVTFNFFEIAGMVRHDITENISLQGGVAIQMSAGGSNAQITASAGGASQSKNLNGELTMPTQIGLMAGAGYRVALSPTMDLIPNATFNYFVTSPTPDGKASAHTFTVGARLMFN